jgi:hypothetical protein
VASEIRFRKFADMRLRWTQSANSGRCWHSLR